MGFTLEHIHRTVHRLGRLMPAKPNKNSKREYSLKEVIFLMAPKLMEMKQMGFSTSELTAALESDDIEIKGQTLNRYLCEYQSIQERDGGTSAVSAVPEAAQDISEKDDREKRKSGPTKTVPEAAEQRKVTESAPHLSDDASGTLSALGPDLSEGKSAKPFWDDKG